MSTYTGPLQAFSEPLPASASGGNTSSESSKATSSSSSTIVDATESTRIDSTTSSSMIASTPLPTNSSSSSSGTDGASMYTLSNSTILNAAFGTNSNSAPLSSTTSSSSVATTALGPATSAANSGIAQTESSHSWLSVPLFAGVVAGSFVVGAFVAGLFVFALFKRRSSRSQPEQNMDQSRYSSSHDVGYIGEKGSPMVTMTTLVESSFLPQQAEDAEVKRRILSLTDQIDQHVENFYHNKKVQIDGNLEASIACYETRQMPNSLAACFEIATQPLALIKHCLAFHIFSRTIAPGEETELILPSDIAGMVSAMYNKCLSPNTPHDTVLAFSLWKNLTGYLRAGETSKRTSQTISNAAFGFAKQFGAGFSAWSDVQYSDDHRNRHLAALVNDAIDDGVWLFRQPDNYRFSWNMLSYTGRDRSSKAIVRETMIVPEVSKVTHKGEPLIGQGQSIVQAVVKSF